MSNKNQSKHIMLRVWLLVGLSAAVLAAFFLRLVSFQLINGETYLAEAEKTQTYKFTVSAARGDIVDRYGRSIATNVTGYKVELSDGMLTGDRNATLKELVEILQTSGEEWNDTTPLTFDEPYAFTVDLTADYSEDATLAREQKKLTALKERFGKQNYATADEVMEAMVKAYKLEEYEPKWQRILAGIRYQMELDGFGSQLNFTLASDVSMKTVSIIKERSLTLTGAEIVETSTRIYPDGSILPHVMGSVGPIYSENWKDYKAKGYRMNDIVGHGGLEEAMEESLRGKDGTRMVEYSKDGTIHRSWLSEDPQPGDTVVLTIDQEFQKKVDAALESRILSLQKQGIGNGRECDAGAVVAIDPKTGGILALSTFPTYDLNDYRSNYNTYSTDESKPLLNRALQGVYSPGSTYKPGVGIAGMVNGVVNASTTINCLKKYTVIEGIGPSCLGRHGPISLANALQVSCNYYFFDVGRQLGLDTFGDMTKRMGLGVKTGIEVGESLGHITSTKDEDYTYGFVLNAAIGQQNTLVTPIQLATYAATLANGGTRWRTHLVAGLRDTNTGELVQQFDPVAEDVIEDTVGAFDTVRQGMVQMAQYNSQGLKDYPLTVAAKTGTPQTGKFVRDGSGKLIELYNGALICYAPAEDPQIAIAILLEKSGSGASAAYLAREVLDAYFFSSADAMTPDSENVLLP